MTEDQQSTETPTEETPTEETPDTGKETDWKAEAEKWKAHARKHEGQAKANADAARRLQELEDRDKSESQKLSDKASEAEKRASAAEARALRYEVAAAKGVPADYHEFLTGDTREELEAKADKLLALAASASSGEGATSDLSRRPKEKLKPGATPASQYSGASMNDFIRKSAGR